MFKFRGTGVRLGGGIGRRGRFRICLLWVRVPPKTVRRWLCVRAAGRLA